MTSSPLQADERPAPDHTLPDAALGKVLLRLARQAILERLGRPSMSDHASTDDGLQAAAVAAMLQAPGATFVTLTVDGELRGCIGTLEAHRPLAEDVTENARAAAFSDYRFAPLSVQELPGLRVEVSLLGPAEPLPARSEPEAASVLVPGRDGVILAAEGRRATFLPQVWESLPDPHQFIDQLRRKAGLPAGSWPPSIALWRYQVRKWKEQS